jgi:hypothetical protein
MTAAEYTFGDSDLAALRLANGPHEQRPWAFR